MKIRIAVIILLFCLPIEAIVEPKLIENQLQINGQEFTSSSGITSGTFFLDQQTISTYRGNFDQRSKYVHLRDEQNISVSETETTTIQESSEASTPLLPIVVILFVIGGFGYIVWMFRGELSRL